MLASSWPAAGAELVAHWAMERPSISGTLSSDLPGLDGTLHSFPIDTPYDEGVLGEALVFDGVDDYVTHPFDLPRDAGTIGHWLLPSNSANKIVLYWSDSPAEETDYNGFGSTSPILEIHTGALGSVPSGVFQDGAGPTNTAGSGTRIVQAGALGSWTHVAMTWDVAGDLVLFVNCTEVARQPMTDAFFDGRTIAERFIGRPSEAIRFWAGAIDEIRVYDEALTPAEVSKVFCPTRRYEDATVFPNAPATSDGFGFAVALDGDTMIVGSPGRDLGASSAGSVQLFERAAPGAAWSFVVEKTASTPVTSGLYGNRLALSGDYAVVAAPGPKKAYLLERDLGGADSWGEALALAADGDDFGAFATDVDVDGALAAVLSQFVYVYERGSSSWSRVARIEEPKGGSPFTGAVAISGDAVAVGTAGGVNLFRRNLGGPNAWGLEREIPRPAEAPFWASFGALDLEGDVLIVGARAENGGQGAAYVYERHRGGASQWGLATRLEADDADPQDGFGQSIALASESVALVGTLSQSPDHNSVYLVRRADGDWSTLALLLDAEGRRSDEFAFSVALDGSIAVAGASGKNTLTGSVLEFDLAGLAGYPLFADDFESGDQTAWIPSPP